VAAFRGEQTTGSGSSSGCDEHDFGCAANRQYERPGRCIFDHEHANSAAAFTGFCFHRCSGKFSFRSEPAGWQSARSS
jgi:hypothetical protein